LAAAAAAAQQAPEPRTGDTVSLQDGAAPAGGQPAPPTAAEPVWHETQAIVPRPAQHPEQPPAEPAWTPPAVEQPGPVDETGGIGGIFGGPTRAGEAAEPQSPGRPAAPAGGAGRSRRGLLVVLAAVVLVVLLGLGGLWLTRGGSADDAAEPAPTSTSTPTSAAPTTPAALPVGTVQTVADTEYTLQVVRYDTTCRDHAYGAISGFFGTTDCLGLSRALWSAEVDGVAAVVSVSRVTMPDSARATALLSLTDVSGTGNVSDLLREGARYPGGPEQLRNADYASATEDDVAVIVETSWVGQAGAAAGLQQLADDGVQLLATQ
ncbi:hypothetical protein NH342_10650, partial [Klenkia sp. PcliD-1-E]|nr:hypothetical protein [Klenkia sp. PcliD-1-E]